MTQNFRPGQILDPEAARLKAESIERSEISRAERKAKYGKSKGANVPNEWTPWCRPSDDEVNHEILSKMKKGKIK